MFILLPNYHYLANNGALRKKIGQCGASSNKMVRCVRNAWADFWSQSALVLDSHYTAYTHFTSVWLPTDMLSVGSHHLAIY